MTRRTRVPADRIDEVGVSDCSCSLHECTGDITRGISRGIRNTAGSDISPPCPKRADHDDRLIKDAALSTSPCGARAEPIVAFQGPNSGGRTGAGFLLFMSDRPNCPTRLHRRPGFLVHFPFVSCRLYLVPSQRFEGSSE